MAVLARTAPEIGSAVGAQWMQWCSSQHLATAVAPAAWRKVGGKNGCGTPVQRSGEMAVVETVWHAQWHGGKGAIPGGWVWQSVAEGGGRGPEEELGCGWWREPQRKAK